MQIKLLAGLNILSRLYVVFNNSGFKQDANNNSVISFVDLSWKEY